MNHVVKRKGHKEAYDGRKVYASIYAACLSLRVTSEEAELIAGKVVKEVWESLKDKSEVSSQEISRLVVSSFKNYHPDASYLYEHHKDVS